MFNRKKLVRSLASLAVIAFAGHSFGAVIHVTNGSSGWTVTRTTSSVLANAGDYLTFPYDGTPTTVNAVQTSSVSSFWDAKNDSRLATAQWITALASSGSTTSDPFSTRYVFNGSFNLAQPSSLKLAFAADNLVDSLTVSTAPDGGGTILGTFTNTVSPIGTQNVVGVGRIWGFTDENIQSLNLNAPVGTVYLKATMYNYGGPPVVGHFENGSAYGFILAVDATTIPEPASLSILGCAAAGLLLRRKTKR